MTNPTVKQHKENIIKDKTHRVCTPPILKVKSLQELLVPAGVSGGFKLPGGNVRGEARLLSNDSWHTH